MQRFSFPGGTAVTGMLCLAGLWGAAVYAERADAGVDLVFVDYQQLAEKKLKIQRNDPETREEYQSLIEKANQALEQALLSVTQKKFTPPSGDKHDYLSQAPYWWPNPSTPNGLPYVRRDGRVNPETRGDNMDYVARGCFFDAVYTLGMAAFYSDEGRYAEKTVALLEAWFVAPETRMNPHLEYAQGIPGLYDGRGYGIIEWNDIENLITPIQLLHAQRAIPEKTYRSLVDWFEQYLDWLQNSEKGRFERDRLNNHGTWYDVQVAGLLLFLDRKEQARAVLETVKTKRIAAQIEPDGRQPEELARTKSLSYSRMNLEAFKQLAFLGSKVGVDLWNYRTPDGRSIAKAQEFLEPYLRQEKQWPYQQIKPLD